MKVVTRYLLRAHLAPFAFAFVALTGVILINTVARELAGLAGKGLQMSVVLEFFMLSMPANIALTLPMSVLVAVLHAFSTLGADNEITALRASGIDLRRATAPLLVVAAVITGGMIWFNDQVLPASNYKWRILMFDVAQTRPLLAFREQAFNRIPGPTGSTPYYLEARELDRNTGEMRDVSIYDLSNDQITRTIVADSGRIAQDPDQTDLLLTLFDGHVREISFGMPAEYRVFEFGREVMRLKDVSKHMQRTFGSEYRTDRDMTMAMMQERIDSLRSERALLVAPRDTAPAEPDSVAAATAEAALAAADSAPVAGLPPGMPEEAISAMTSVPADQQSPLSTPPGPDNTIDEIAADAAANDARQYAEARLATIDFEIRRYRLEIHKKFAIASATLVFVLIGIPTALRFPRGGIGMVMAVSLAIFGIYYVGLIGGEKLSDKGYVPPVAAMWMTNIIFGTLGLIAFSRLGREQGTSRGGGGFSLAGIVDRFRRAPGGRR